ncbi:MAG: glycosyltransferase [Paludibacteraceae bacterium]|nr:glycosyltransferase [Paludibacteraceae bacterium]
MKILFVIDTYYTSNNGTSISAQRYAAILRQMGHEVRILCGDKPENEAGRKLQVGTDFYAGTFIFPGCEKACRKNEFFFGKVNKPVIREAINWADIVHVFTPLFFGSATIKECNKIGKPVTAAFHVQPENITSQFGLGKVGFVNNYFYGLFRRGTFNRVRHVHAPSFFIANEMRKHNYTAQPHIISNGINEEFIHAGEKKLAARTSTPQDDPNRLIKIMMIGRLSQEKRQDVIINAVKYSKYADRIQLVFAGHGPELERYQELGKTLKHQPQFLFLQRDELIEELLTTDLYIHASDMEIEAISCIEAFATGLVPVIANSPDSATPQFALDERSLFRPGDPKDLARAIDYWLDNPQERHLMEEKYAENAHKYTIEQCVALFEQMLQQEIAEHCDDKQSSAAGGATPPQPDKRTMIGAIKRRITGLYKRIA